ncbi:MAG: DoxX family protein [Thermomicrobiales bacterium]
MRLGRTEGWAAVGMLLLRLAVGIVLAAHGWQKFHDMGVSNVAGFFGSIGIPAPGIMAWVVTLIELVGGVALILGLFTRIVTPLVAATMVVAILTVKKSIGLIGAEGPGYELDLLILGAALALFFAGPGIISLDRFLPVGPDSDAATR